MKELKNSQNELKNSQNELKSSVQHLNQITGDLFEITVRNNISNLFGIRYIKSYIIKCPEDLSDSVYLIKLWIILINI